jgi:hypothetical protein
MILFDFLKKNLPILKVTILWANKCALICPCIYHMLKSIFLNSVLNLVHITQDFYQK